MARTVLTVVKSPSMAGITLGANAGDASNMNSFPAASGKVYCHLRNSNAGSTARTATFHAVTTTRPADAQFPAQSVADIVVSVAAGVEKIVGPFPAAYIDASQGVMIDPSHAELLISPFEVAQG